MMFIYDLVLIDYYQTVDDIVRSGKDILEYLVAGCLEFFTFQPVASRQISFRSGAGQ
jgi:hypothetical protein